MNRSAAHTKLCRDIAVALSAIPDVLVTFNPSGRAQFGRASIAYGAFGPGAPDLLICARGRLVCIEAKTGEAEQRPDQRACQRRIEMAGGVYVVARSVDDATRAIASPDEIKAWASKTLGEMRNGTFGRGGGAA